ncbi:MAG: glutamate 5-kinase, partial [Candidatus Omnitrophica bacterium]|nr:glutamate 5-kinase [Candidatus Omnitrophota bacterium]
MKNKIVVIKIGTKVIASSDKSLDKERLKSIVGQIADLLDSGIRVIVVTSGAIGAGMALLGLKKRPVRLEDLQAAASIGQSHLMQLYSTYLKERGYLAGQILLTQEDFNDRARYLNIKYTILTLFGHKAVPVINENDTVSTEEIRCGDNDRLSCLVGGLCHADLLILLSDVDGLLDEKHEVINIVDEIDSRVSKFARSSRCELGTGG